MMLVVVLLAGCQEFPDQKDQGIFWASSPQIPVWVTHPLPSKGNTVWFVGEGTSLTTKKLAISRAEDQSFQKIWKWFSHRGIRSFPEERQKIESIWKLHMPTWLGQVGGCSSEEKPILCDDWIVKRMSHPERKEAWVLVGVPRNTLRKMRQSFLWEDSVRLQRMKERDLYATKLLSEGNSLAFMIALERNSFSSSHFHSLKLMSPSDQEQFKNLNRKTFSEMWTIRRTLKIQPVKVSSSSLILPVGRQTSTSYYWRSSFRMHGIIHPINGLPLSLFLDPARRFPDFPFVSLYPLVGFSHSKALWIYQSLVSSGDLAILQKERNTAWMASKCHSSNKNGIGHCILYRISVYHQSGKICVRPASGFHQAIPDVVKREVSCIDVAFYHRRGLHPMRMILDVPQEYRGRFQEQFSKRLEAKGFLIQSNASDRYFGQLKEIFFDRERLSGVSLYSDALSFDGMLVDGNGVVRWLRKIDSTGFGFSKTESRHDALDKLLHRISNDMDRAIRVETDPVNASFLGRGIPMVNAWVGVGSN